MKKIVKLLFAVSAILALAACSSGGSKSEGGSKGTTDTKEDKGLEVIGENVKFDPNKLVNEGEPITIEYWTWNEAEPAVAQTKEYEKIYPNVKINVKVQPWDDYWTKLPLSLKGKDGPALFNIHNSQDSTIKPYLAPYDISIKDLEADFLGAQTHEENGKIYYTDSLINSGTIYYNKKLWKEAGLSDADIPKTWDQFREVAKKLTKKDGNKITQAGFNFNQEYETMIYGLNYQKGALMFKDDGKSLNFNSDVTKENTQFLVDLYEKDKVGSKDFGDESSLSFGNGQTAMVYRWGWFQAELQNKYKDIDYGVFPTPTFDEEVPFAYDRYNGESTPGINNKQSKEQQAVAQDFLKFLLAGDQYSIDGALSMGSFPAKKSLAENEKILADPVLKVLSERVDHLIWPGAFPSTVETSAKKAMEDIQFNGMTLDKALSQGQAQMEKDMKGSDFVSQESKYQYFEEK